ncbi:DUF4351 domain-containing protein [Desulfococcaceae bacterium HSG9]|nr:DUF4351 domain-containing protein [Desulfococcaceae bacterium HSG9]
MTRESHDHNFKNLFSDFPTDALEWLLPQALQIYGTVRRIDFLRQEPDKHHLKDSSLALDMPILFTFDSQSIILWLVEFQEDKSKFSIYKLLNYKIKMMEAYPQALVIPTVLFTDRKQWRKDVDLCLDTEFAGKTFLHFEFIKIKLFDYDARDHFHSNNPLVRILLPKMHYVPEERFQVIWRAYLGLFELASPKLFDKYAYFIDIYANIHQKERQHIFRELKETEETLMLYEYIKDKGFQQGMKQGMRQGMQQGMQQGELNLLSKQIAKKFNLTPENIMPKIKELSHEIFTELSENYMY